MAKNGIGFMYNLSNNSTGARLTKAYDVTNQRCRKSHAKIEDSKMHILRCMGSKFCMKFQRCPLKFHTKFWTHTPQNMHFMRCWKFDDLWYLKSYDILSLSETGPRSDKSFNEWSLECCGQTETCGIEWCNGTPMHHFIRYIIGLELCLRTCVF